MELTLFPFERVVQINVFILENYRAHLVELIMLLRMKDLNDFEVSLENEFLADAMRDLVLNKINDSDFADILYAQYLSNK